MGCSVSVSQPIKPLIAGGKQLNAAEKVLQEAKEEESMLFKILLLGAGESGKSTVVKQVKLAYNIQEPEHEIRKYVQALQRNVIEAMQTLLHASKELNVPIEDPILSEKANEIVQLDEQSRVTSPLAPIVDQLWKDPGIQKVFARRDEFWNMDATPYYLNEVYRIADKDFKPNDEDMIMARVRTTGIVVSEIVEKPLRFQIVDVGGQRSERRKWIHCFDDVKAIIYLASLSGYNQVLFEDSSENIMRESLKLFEEVVKNPLFKNTPIYVFLNKKDLFEELIKVHSLKKCFPDYDGPEKDMNAALQYIQKKFEQVLETHTPHKKTTIHVIAARVRRDIKLAFGEVKENLKKQYKINAQTIAEWNNNQNKSISKHSPLKSNAVSPGSTTAE
mmetsp:Transcript_13742/g.14944  ORF Transcript_13742/g.14944 Transcript_13742/m.14944 type:complete len:389 (-) Transcript_13742:1361-2527(-)